MTHQSKYPTYRFLSSRSLSLSVSVFLKSNQVVPGVALSYVDQNGNEGSPFRGSFPTRTAALAETGRKTVC